MSDPGISQVVPASTPIAGPTSTTPAAPAPVSPPPTYQYNFLELTTDTSNEEMTTQLNALGANGWKVVAASATEEFYIVYLMKEC